MTYVKINSPKRRKAIKKLRKEDQLAKSCNPNDTTLDQHSVDELVIEIARRGLNDKSHLNKCAERIYLSRENCHLSLKSVAKKLGVTHPAIINEEKGKKDKISQYFLLGFSLLYHVSPLYLIGETDNDYCYSFDGLVAPMDFISPELCDAVNAILENTYQAIDEFPGLNSMLLEIILKLCESSFGWSRAIRQLLLDSPAIKVLNANKLHLTNPNINYHDIWISQYKKLISDGRENERTEIEKACDRLLKWGASDFHTLNLFAHISGAEPPLKEAVCLFLIHGGFLSDQNHFHQNSQRSPDSKKLHEAAD